MLDESTSALDISYQLDVMETLVTLIKLKKIAAVMAMHDLNMASRYADRILMFKEGRMYTDGSPVNVLTRENIAGVYGVEASVRTDDDGKPSIVPIRRFVAESHGYEERTELKVRT